MTLYERITEEYPELPNVMMEAESATKFTKRQVTRDEAAVLYREAYKQFEGEFLEIGTANGFSAYVIAKAAPAANIITLNPNPHEYRNAVMGLVPQPHVHPICMKSWEYLEIRRDAKTRKPLDFIFVDGDHDLVRLDLPWFDELRVGGLILFHDCKQDGVGNVYGVLQEMKSVLGRPFDLYYDTRRGMAGWYKRHGEMLNGEE